MYGSKHRTTDGLYENRKDGSGYSSTKREWNLQTHGFNDDSSNHRKYIRTQSSSNNRSVPSSSSSSSQQQRQNGDKEKKSVKDAKKPLRVSGDWSEFKSSTGKTYFYNCKTEISQWEKPKGWLSDGASSSSSTRPSSTTSNSTKKESNSNDSPTVRTRYKMEESSYHQRYSQAPPVFKLTSSSSSHNNHHHNGESHDNPLRNVSQESLASNEQPSAAVRLPSPGDDSSRMSFSSSSSSKESSLIAVSERNGPVGNESNGQILHSSLSEPAIPVSNSIVDTPNKLVEVNPIISSNGTDPRMSTIRPNTESTQAMEIESPSPAISKAERDNEIQKFYRAELIQHLTDWPSTQLEKQCLKLFDEYYGYSAKMSTAFTELKALKSNFRVLEIKRSIQTQRLLRCQQHAKEREDDKLL